MGIGGEKQRAVDAVLPAVLADGLRDGKNVVLIERRVEGRPTMA